jgi:hypothetical protein
MKEQLWENSGKTVCVHGGWKVWSRKRPSPAAKRRDLSPQERGEVMAIEPSLSKTCCNGSCFAVPNAFTKEQVFHLAPFLRGEVAALRRG